MRLGALCLVSAALAEIPGLIFRGPLASPARAPGWFIEVSVSPKLHVGWVLLLTGAMLQCFGWLAVYRWRRDSSQESWAFWGMVLSITAIIAFLPVSGALGFTAHEAALAEAAGARGAVALVAATAEGPVARIFLIVSVLTGLIAIVLWSGVLWRVPSLARWVVPLLILHTVTQSITAPILPPWGYRLERLGALGFAVACAAIAVRIWRDAALDRTHSIGAA
ncbi:MAG TPA: hypothetical protein VMT66_09865 [Steroidobacteraceae bacterium]|nr:hypothetical protein [Steroidobacteraceae bacterium]